jgi:hypothetical protein
VLGTCQLGSPAGSGTPAHRHHPRKGQPAGQSWVDKLHRSNCCVHKQAAHISEPRLGAEAFKRPVHPSFAWHRHVQRQGSVVEWAWRQLRRVWWARRRWAERALLGPGVPDRLNHVAVAVDDVVVDLGGMRTHSAPCQEKDFGRCLGPLRCQPSCPPACCYLTWKVRGLSFCSTCHSVLRHTAHPHVHPFS